MMRHDFKVECLDIGFWAGEWLNNPSYQKLRESEIAALDAGIRLLTDNPNVNDLKIIGTWKLANQGERFSRQLHEEFDRNKSEDVEEAVKIARSCVRSCSAISVLTGLHGVGARMSSAILTAMRPKDYAVIDKLALRALGERREHVDYLRIYPRYLCACKSLRQEKFSLREVDHALWAYGKKYPAGPLAVSTITV